MQQLNKLIVDFNDVFDENDLASINAKIEYDFVSKHDYITIHNELAYEQRKYNIRTKVLL